MFSQTPSRPPEPRDASGNNANHEVSWDPNTVDIFVGSISCNLQNDPGDARGDVAAHYSYVPAILRRGRRSEVEIVEPHPSSTRKLQWRPAQDYPTRIFKHIARVVADGPHSNRLILLLTLGIPAVWFLLSMMASQLVLLTQPMCSSPILKGPLTPTRRGQLPGEKVGYWGPAPAVGKGGAAGDTFIPFVGDVEGKEQATGGLDGFVDDPRGTIITGPNDTFSWPDGDVILRSTYGTERRKFQVHKPFLSFASPIFKAMITNLQHSSSVSNIDTIHLSDPPRALELILRFIYPSPAPPVVDDLTVAFEALNIANKYDIEVARSRLRTSLAEFTKTEPLRVYAIACRLGYEDEMKIASTHTLSINLPALTQLPDEFKSIPATEYHRLIHLHMKYRNEAVAITTSSLPNRAFEAITRMLGVLLRALVGKGDRGAKVAAATMKKHIVDIIMQGTPLDYESITLALKTDYRIDVESQGVGNVIHSVLDKINALNLTV